MTKTKPYRGHAAGKHQRRILALLYPDLCWAQEKIEQGMGVSDAKTRSISLRGLVTNSLVEHTEEGCYRLTDAGRKAHEAFTFSPDAEPLDLEVAKADKAKIRDSMRQGAWSLLRMGQPVIVAELAAMADKTGHDQTTNMRKYLLQLERFGFVKRLPHKRRPNVPRARRQTQYQLIKNTGPITPVYLSKQDQMMDLNREEMLTCPQR